jgi:hypothetical protein
MVSNVATKKAARVTRSSRKSTTEQIHTTAEKEGEVNTYFAELRQQYADGKLSSRQIAAVESRFGGWSWLEGINGPKPGAKMSDAEIEDWMIEVRTLYANNKLPTWQIARLEQIPGWIWA